MLRLLNNVFEQLFNKKYLLLFLPLFPYFWIDVFSPEFINPWKMTYWQWPNFLLKWTQFTFKNRPKKNLFQFKKRTSLVLSSWLYKYRTLTIFLTPNLTLHVGPNCRFEPKYLEKKITFFNKTFKNGHILAKRTVKGPSSFKTDLGGWTEVGVID